MSGILDGLRVVDCSRGVAGTRAGGLFADYGAEVVRVEPIGGDPWRDELAIPYSVFNRGKRSVCIDLKTPEGHEEILELLATADLFLESWSPGVAESLGLSYSDIHERFPGLVYCSLTGWGLDGPQRDVRGYEALVQAFVGTMAEQIGHREGPIYEGLPFAGIGASALIVLGGLAALYRRMDDGVGRRVETSLLDGALAYLGIMWGDREGAGHPFAGGHRLVGRNLLCADDVYITLHTGAVGAFGRLMKLIGLDDRIPPSESGLDMGMPLEPWQGELLHKELDRVFALETRDVWLKRLLDADICAMPALEPLQVFDEPQVAYNNMVLTLNDPVLGAVEQVAPAMRFSAAPIGDIQPAPTPGQHSAEVSSPSSERQSLQETSTHASTTAARTPLLDGVRILDLSAYYAGPYASRLLGNFGAEVITLEPLGGNPVRGLERPTRSGMAGKKSIAADLKNPSVGPIRDKLVQWADIVHHNMRPGAAERLGVEYEQVRALNPEVIYLYAPGWGADGPDKSRQSFAPQMSVYVGAGFEVGGQFNPPLYPAGHEDPGAGLISAIGMVAALIHRRRTGHGQLVLVPQLNVTMTHLAHMVRVPGGSALGAEQLDPLQMGLSATDRLYRTSDGWICLVAAKGEEIAALVQVTGVDPKFLDAQTRKDNDYALADALASIIETKSVAEWLDVFGSVGVPAVEPVQQNNSVPFHNDPENQRTGRVAVFEDPNRGLSLELDKLVRVSDDGLAPHVGAPMLGEHTDEILTRLGYDAETIRELRTSKAVGGGQSVAS
jgi:crotonobetainyl-CoA:carnitine CoA-transferase CaiB-like acyl-CoA transferase